MPTASPVMNFLLTRRSRPAKMLTAPAPDRAELSQLLTAAARVPDHGKLEPWRFIALTPPALTRLAAAVAARATEKDLPPDACEKAVTTFTGSPLVVAVVASPKPSEKIPEIEQTLSVGGVCLSLVNAALASGWGACWLTGWPAMDRPVQESLGLAPHEWIAGFVHIGTSNITPPDRPRPDIAHLTEWRE
ncbi:MAG: nitroreductase [Roseinatronobacter sp.]